uniref:DUF4220 domain-containing protein n=1 Tax=Oryza brachyantha TaxID=4533 RepID=J3LVJ1_ORYBR
MFVVGVVKYGERTWALRCGDMNTIRSSLKKELHTKCYYHIDDKPERRSFNEGHFKREADEEEFLVRCAHSLFHVCKYAIVDSSDDSGGDTHFRDKEIFNGLTDEQTYALMGIELSLMYDMLYTKTSVISGWIIGYCIRVISSLATAGSLVIFQFNGKDGQNRVDVAITYVLLIGAFLMEVTSLLRALGSSWTFSFLCATWWKWLNHVAMCSGRWHRFRRNVVSLRHFLKAMGISRYCLSSRRWSGSMGQYNMLHFCTRRGTSFTSRLIGRLAIMLGLEDWWETVHYSGTVEILQKVKEMVFQHIRNIVGKRDVNTLGIIRKTWGQETSELWKLNDEQRTHLMGSEFQEGIIIWHIATELFLAKPKITDDQNEQPTVQAIKALSNYMMFLLVDRPDMLPGLAQNRLYQRSLKFLSEEIWPQVISDPTYRHPSRNVYTMLKELFRLHDNPNSDSWRPQGEKLASKLWEVHKNYVDDKLNAILKPEGSRVIYAVNVAEELERKNEGSDPLKLLLETWTNFLVYAANRCSRESHARKLNSGAMFIGGILNIDVINLSSRAPYLPLSTERHGYKTGNLTEYGFCFYMSTWYLIETLFPVEGLHGNIYLSHISWLRLNAYS